MMQRSSLFWGALLILVGLVLFLDNQGLLDSLGINVWNLLWPVFLILLGLWLLMGNFFRSGEMIEQSLTLPSGGSTRAQLRFNHGAGRLSIHSGAASPHLLEGNFSGGVQYNQQLANGFLKVDLRVPPNTWMFFPFSIGPGFSRNWDVSLNSDTLLALELKTGANEMHLDLRDLKVTDLRIATGASSTDLRLPDNAGFTKVKIESGAASVSIEVPPQVAARLQAGGGLADFQIDQQRFPRSGNFYQSLDYSDSPNRVDITIETGVGSVKVV